MMKRYLSLWFPDWPLTRLRRARILGHNTARRPEASDQDSHRPFILVEHGKHGLIVAAANASARKLAIQTGLSFADAKARIPELGSEHINRHDDQTALEALALWLIRVAPQVAIDERDGLILDTTGCDHLYGGEPAMMQKVSALLTENNLPHRLAIAGTPVAASALARAQSGDLIKPGKEAEGLADLSISTLRLSSKAEILLQRFGLSRVGQLYSIDRKALERRFPSKHAVDAVLRRLDQALGKRPDPIHPIRPAPAQSVRLSCPDPISTSTALSIGLAQLADMLCDELCHHGLGARSFTLHAFRADSTHDSISINTAKPARAREHILHLFDEKLAELDPGFGIDILVLEANRTGPMDISSIALSGDLASRDTDPVALAALADRLSAKLGETAIAVNQTRHSHIPERAQFIQAFNGDIPTLSELPGGPRPLRFLDPPELVEIIAAVPDGPPQSFTWRRLTRSVRRVDGPERIGPEWWQYQKNITGSAVITRPGPKPDTAGPDSPHRAHTTTPTHHEDAANQLGLPVRKRPRSRDYYRVEDENGQRYWLFRNGLDNDGRGGPPDWYIHGLFA